MLSDEERQAIVDLADQYERRRSAVIEALTMVQDRRGWIDDESLAEVARVLGMSADDVDSVATGYNLIRRRPVGRHVILLCDSVSCWLTGYPEVLAHLQGVLGIDFGETTEDGRFTMLPVACLGACDRAPAMMIDSDLHVNLTAEHIDEVLARYE